MLERYKRTDPKKQVIEVEADGDDWVMESIIANGPSDNNPKQHVFLVKWEDYTQEEYTWETYENVNEHYKEPLEDYYRRNPTVEKDGRFSKPIGRKKIRKRT